MSRLSQYVSFPFIWILAKMFLKVEIKGAEKLKNARGPLVVIANHISWYDGFLLRLATVFHSLPIRFMGVKTFNGRGLNFLKKIGVVSLTYAIFGVFEVFPGKGIEKNLKIPRHILNEGGTVLVFPEGTMNKTGGLLPFRRGAAALAITTGAPVLPLVFKRGKGRIFRSAIDIEIGNITRLSSNMNYEDGTERLERIMRNLLGA